MTGMTMGPSGPERRQDPFRSHQFEQLLLRLTTLAQRTRGHAETFEVADTGTEASQARGGATAMAAMIAVLQKETRRNLRG
jgi:hypothetical protein